MQTKKKGYIADIVTLVMFLLAGHLLGQVKAPGKILIPTARGIKSYKAVISITQDGIEIECRKKIFRLFNKFDTPWHRKLRIKTADFSEIWVHEGSIYIFAKDVKYHILHYAKDSFFQGYRNIFHFIWRRGGVVHGPFLEMAIVFVPDNPAAI